MEILKKENLFYLGNENNPDAYLKYSFRDENTISIDSTFVDPKLRGEGVAKLLTDKVVDLAKENNYKIIPVCSYAVMYFEKNQELTDLLK